MPISIETLSAGDDTRYDAFLCSFASTLLFVSSKYRKFLEQLLPDCEADYLVALQGGEIVGALPTFTRRNPELGSVVNSLPFFGSNGGVLVPPDLPCRDTVQQALLDAWRELVKAKCAVAATIISNPLEPQDQQCYASTLDYRFCDERIGQYCVLPSSGEPTADLADRLMATFHQKTRNSIRKALRSGFQVSQDGSPESWRELCNIHTQNMSAIGGLAKPWSVFDALRQTFEFDRDYTILIARRDEITAAALLVLFFNRTAEYYTPVVRSEFRSCQPMNLLVMEAMQEAVKRGCSFWNWGGTWASQDGVYRFKKRWGSKDEPYHYYVSVYDDAILNCTPTKLLEAFPNFYVVPFSELRAANAN